jgi:hypothetical protein
MLQQSYLSSGQPQTFYDAMPDMDNEKQEMAVKL